MSGNQASASARRKLNTPPFPIKLIAVAPSFGRDGDFAILETRAGNLRKVRRSAPVSQLQAMLRAYGISKTDPRAAAFVLMVRRGTPMATF